MTFTEILSESWRLSSWAWLAVALVLAAYLRLLWRQVAPRHLGYLAVAVVVFLVAMVSPVATLADGYLFSAHMVQHLLLLLIVPMMFMLALPQRPLTRLFARGSFDRFGQALAYPPVGWLCGIGVMWVWHLPPCCDGSLLNPWIALLKIATLLLAGFAFWWPVFSPVARYRCPPEGAVMYLFSGCLGCTLLGIFLTFTTNTVCPAYATFGDPLGIRPSLLAMGLTPAVDQQLGGLMMWVPACTIYLSSIIAVLRRWYRVTEEQENEQTISA